MAERQLGLALDFSPTSIYALKWGLNNLVRDGDTLILIVVHKKTDHEESAEHLWGASGSPLIPFDEFKQPSVMRRYDLHANEEVNEILSEFLHTKKITVVGKVYYGDARDKLVNAIVELPIDALIMGSRGLGGLKKVFLGSVSNYVVNNAPCPVTVVKLPESEI